MPVQGSLYLRLDSAMVPVHHHQNHECVSPFNIQATCFDISLPVTFVTFIILSISVSSQPTVTSCLLDPKGFPPSPVLEDQKPT
jgi:hypothetical protein